MADRARIATGIVTYRSSVYSRSFSKNGSRRRRLQFFGGKWKSRKAETGTGTGTENGKGRQVKNTELNGSHHVSQNNIGLRSFYMQALRPVVAQ